MTDRQTDRQTEGRTGGVAISPVPGPMAPAGDNTGGVAISPVPGPTAPAGDNKGIEDIMDIDSNCPYLLFGETTSHLTSK